MDLVESVIAPDIICWGSALFCKKATVGKSTPWHQAGHYWSIKPLAKVTVWIAIDPATVENSYLWVIPGSHINKKLYDHKANPSDEVVLNQELNIAALDLNALHDLLLAVGEFSVHDIFYYL